MKPVSYILILSLFLTFQPFVFAQTQTPSAYEADMFVKSETSVDKKAVILQQENGVLKITGKKDKNINRSFANSSIKKADYSYSEKPQITQAIIVSLLTNDWLMGLPFLFTKTKKHWLVISTENDAVLLELQKETYRKLLFEMNVNGIKVEDLGDRDSKETPLQKPKPAADFIEGESCS